MYVSVITPSFQQKQFIEATLQSVADQDYARIEHIVRDGGSTDGTVEILKEHEDFYNLKWHSAPDEGQGDAVNDGLEVAEGDIVGWLNSDDLYAFEDTISLVVRVFERNPEVDVIYGDALRIDGKGRIRAYKRVPPWDRDELLRRCFLVQPAVFFRSRVCEREELRTDLEYALDYEYWLRLSERYTFRRVEKVVAADRWHAERKTYAGADTMIRQSEIIRRSYGYDGADHYGDRPDWLEYLSSSLPRRLEGVGRLFRLRKRKEKLVEGVDWDGVFPILLRHLTPIQWYEAIGLRTKAA